jgi:hypothetical protein
MPCTKERFLLFVINVGSTVVGVHLTKDALFVTVELNLNCDNRFHTHFAAETSLLRR